MDYRNVLVGMCIVIDDLRHDIVRCYRKIHSVSMDLRMSLRHSFCQDRNRCLLYIQILCILVLVHHGNRLGISKERDVLILCKWRYFRKRFLVNMDLGIFH